MAMQNLSTVTNELIESYGNTAKNVINAYRVGNERAISFVDQRFSDAVEKTSTRLNADLSSAVNAQRKVSSLYAQGVVLTSESADLAVNKAIELAGKGVTQVAANAGRFEKATGVTTLKTLAEAAGPAAQAATKVAAKLEAKSGELVNVIAGSKAKVKVAAVKRSVKKAVVKAAAPKAAAPKAAPKKAAAAKAAVVKAEVATEAAA